MSKVPRRSDPLTAAFYKSLKSAEFVTEFFFYVAGVLSIVVLFVSRQDNGTAYDALYTLFVMSVLLVFFGGIINRLYWSSRAHAGRVADFFSNAFGVKLASEISSGYYNSKQKSSFGRIAASLLENTLFTKEISNHMLHFERVRLIVYVAVWVISALNRSTDLAVVGAVAQVVFGEQVVSKWIRLEWLRSRSEMIHQNVFNQIMLSKNFESPQLQAALLEQMVFYETTKAQAGVSLSSRVFNRLNLHLSEKWSQIAASLDL